MSSLLRRSPKLSKPAGGAKATKTTASSACELIPPDASLRALYREHRPHVMPNQQHMAGIIASCFNYLLSISALDGFALPSVGAAGAVAGGGGMRILREMPAAVTTALPAEPGWDGMGYILDAKKSTWVLN